jgi:hypothetical protein
MLDEAPSIPPRGPCLHSGLSSVWATFSVILPCLIAFSATKQGVILILGKEWWAGTGLNRRHQDFQARPRLLPRMHDSSLSVVIHGLRGTAGSRNRRFERHGDGSFGPSRVRVIQAGRVCAQIVPNSGVRLA